MLRTVVAGTTLIRQKPVCAYMNDESRAPWRPSLILHVRTDRLLSDQSGASDDRPQHLALIHPARSLGARPDPADALGQNQSSGIDALLVERLRIGLEYLGVQKELAALAQMLALGRPLAVGQGGVHRR